MKTKNNNLKFGLMSICAVGVAFLATHQFLRDLMDLGRMTENL